MALTQLATRVDERVKRAVEDICKERGLKMNRFIEDALIGMLEELQDVDELRQIRFEATRPLKDVLDELGFEQDLAT